MGVDAWMRAILDYLGLGELIGAIEKYCGPFWTGMLIRLAFLVGFIGLLHFGLTWTFSVPLHKVVWGAIAAFDQIPDLIESRKIGQVAILFLQIPLAFVVAALIMRVADRVAGQAALPLVLRHIQDAKRKANETMAEANRKSQEADPKMGNSTEQPVGASAAADYIEAWGIVDSYIHLAMHDKRPGAKLAIRRDFLDRFGRTPGAMLGDGRYNRELLHQWMQSNAARLLVENRGKMS